MQEKILYLAFGRAGFEVLQILEMEGYNKQNLFVLTYQSPENESFLNYLKEQKYSFTLEHIKNEHVFSQCSDFAPDYLISMHFRDLVPKKYLDLVLGRAMNLHPSLLPKYAGCFATMWVLINEEKETGVTYHLMTEEFDQGNILLQIKTSLHKTEDGHSLYNKCIDLGVQNFVKAFQLLIKNHQGKVQEGEKSYYPRKVPYNGQIDPNWPLSKVDGFIRALKYPGKKGATIIHNNAEFEVNSLQDYQNLLISK